MDYILTNQANKSSDLLFETQSLCVGQDGLEVGILLLQFPRSANFTSGSLNWLLKDNKPRDVVSSPLRPVTDV